MPIFLFYFSLIAAILFYINHVSLLKKLARNKEENTFANTLIGCICSGIIIYSIMYFLMI